MKKARLKILHVVLSLEPGGLENGIVNVARRLNPEEFEVHACCMERGGAFVERLPQPENVSVLHKRPGISPAAIFGLGKVISRVKPDVVHSHNLGPLMYSSLATLLGFSAPVVHGEHGIPVAQRDSKFMRQRRWFYKCCKNVHAVSNGLREELIGYGLPAEKISVILNGVDSERFSPQPAAQVRKKIGLPDEGPVLGIVGRFDRSKRHADLIEAFTRVAQQFPTAQLLLVGEAGNNRDAVVAAARSSPAAKRIHLAGFQNEPAAFYPAMDLLVSASVSEGLSNVILEAMACGVPALAHTATGNAELIISGKNGILLNLGTADDLTRALQKILATADQLSEMGRAARDFAVQRYSMKAMAENYAKLYREAAGRA